MQLLLGLKMQLLLGLKMSSQSEVAMDQARV